ncbi:MAG: SIR2 family NAD-dependent protein deacylase [Methylococcales bacterium]
MPTDTRNDPELDELAEDIAGKNGVLFAGSGLSRQARNAEGNGPPSWEELLILMVDWCEKRRDYFDDARTAGDLRSAIRKGRLLVAAQEILERLDNSFGSCLGECLGKYEPSRAHLLAVGIDWLAILTTNYDQLLERAWELAGRNQRLEVISNPKCANELGRANELLGREAFLMKLHGEIRHPGEIIFGYRQYRGLVHDGAVYKEWLGQILKMYTVLFVGFGARDPDLMHVIDRVAAYYPHRTPRHYLLVSEEESSLFERKRLRKDCGIVCLTYERDAEHKGVERFLERLRDKVQARRR